MRHVAFFLTRYGIGQDGRNVYKRLVGRDCNGSVAEISKQMMSKIALKKQSTEKKHKRKSKRKLAARSVVGTWLGVYPRMGKDIIEATDG